MLKQILSIVLLAICFGFKDATPPSLVVKFSGLRSDDGWVRLILFNQGDGFPKEHDKCVLTKNVLLREEGNTINLGELPPGEYAIAVIHDENGNEKFDFNFIGIPKEGYAFSNNAKALFGVPKFDNAKFALQDDKEVTLQMVYW